MAACAKPAPALLVAREARLDGNAQQLHDPGARRRVGRLARVEERNRNAVGVVDQRRITGEPLPMLQHRQRLRQIAERPRLEAAPLERRAGIAQTTVAPPRPTARASAEVAARGELAAGGIDHPHLHREVRGHRDVVPDIPGRRFAEAGAQPARAARLQAIRRPDGTADSRRDGAADSRPSGTASRNAVTASGSGVSRLRMALGSAFSSTVSFSRINPGTSQVRSASSIWFKRRERHGERQAVSRLARRETGT